MSCLSINENAILGLVLYAVALAIVPVMIEVIRRG